MQIDSNYGAIVQNTPIEKPVWSGHILADEKRETFNFVWFLIGAQRSAKHWSRLACRKRVC